MVEENPAAIQIEENQEHHEEGDVTEDAEAVKIIPTFFNHFVFIILSRWNISHYLFGKGARGNETTG
jgi:hypothetical protein